jgi:hypothetical protein
LDLEPELPFIELSVDPTRNQRDHFGIIGVPRSFAYLLLESAHSSQALSGLANPLLEQLVQFALRLIYAGFCRRKVCTEPGEEDYSTQTVKRVAIPVFPVSCEPSLQGVSQTLISLRGNGKPHSVTWSWGTRQQTSFIHSLQRGAASANTDPKLCQKIVWRGYSSLDQDEEQDL